MKHTSKTIFSNGFMAVDVKTPVGSSAEFVTFDRVKTQTGTIIVPIDEKGRVVLIKEYRIGADEEVISVPKGAKDSNDESYIEVARRELAEELGFRAKVFVTTSTQPYALPAFTKTRGRIAFAFGVEKTMKQNLEAGEQITEYGRFTLAQIKDMLLKGEINDAESVVALQQLMLMMPEPKLLPNMNDMNIFGFITSSDNGLGEPVWVQKKLPTWNAGISKGKEIAKKLDLKLFELGIDVR